MQTTLSDRSPRPLRAGLAANPLLRRIAFPLLRRMDTTITITNPFSGLPFHLLSYTHKGYWFYGKHRESASMKRFAALVRRGDTVFEVGGHIGYLAQFFARQVGHAGQVHIFEPGQQNQQFLRKNLARCLQCVHINAAVSDRTGKATFYEENLGGFMNSLQEDFVETSDLARSQQARLDIKTRKVNTITLDAYATAHNVWPQFIKIDVEGAELAVLRGAPRVLTNARALMVEVARDHDAVFDLLTAAGFVLSAPDGRPITGPQQMDGNVFATRPGASATAGPATADQR